MVAQHIYNILKNSPVISARVGMRIFTWAEWETIRANVWDTLPEITHIDVATRPLNNQLGIHEVTYQVSVWATTQMESREGIQEVVEILNRYHDVNIEACTLESVDYTFDEKWRVHGAHATFAIVIRE